MPQYRRVRIPGSTYFFTVVTYQRQPFLTDLRFQKILAAVIQEVQKTHPFILDAWVYLPDHLHCLWTLPEGDSDFSKRWGLIKARFSKQAKELISHPANGASSRLRRRESHIWQRRFWEHAIRDDDDFRHHVNYIYDNPVKHGLVRRVRDCLILRFITRLPKACMIWIGEGVSLGQIQRPLENEVGKMAGDAHPTGSTRTRRNHIRWGMCC